MLKQTLIATAALITAFASAPLSAEETETAIFAGGCFWCVEKDFEHVEGVVEAVSGYTGGMLPNPTYRNHGKHIEAVKITYNPAKFTYSELVEIFWRSIDPTDAGGQFCDRGHPYTTAIFATSPEQREIAELSKMKLEVAGTLPAPVVTPILDASPWTDAEGYHQDYYKKNPVRYRLYRYGCGRDARIQELWGEDAHKGIS